MRWPTFTYDWGTIITVISVVFTFITFFNPKLVEWIRGRPRLFLVSLFNQIATRRARNLTDRASNIGSSHFSEKRFALAVHALNTQYVRMVLMFACSFLLIVYAVSLSVHFGDYSMAFDLPFKDYRYDFFYFLGVSVEIVAIWMQSNYRQYRFDLTMPDYQVQKIYGEAVMLEHKGADPESIRLLRNTCIGTLGILKARNELSPTIDIPAL